MPVIYFEISVDILGNHFWIERSISAEAPVWHLDGEAVPHSYARGRCFPTGTPGVYTFITDSSCLDADGLERIEMQLNTLVDVEILRLQNFRRNIPQEILRNLNIRTTDR